MQGKIWLHLQLQLLQVEQHLKIMFLAHEIGAPLQIGLQCMPITQGLFMLRYFDHDCIISWSHLVTSICYLFRQESAEDIAEYFKRKYAAAER